MLGAGEAEDDEDPEDDGAGDPEDEADEVGEAEDDAEDEDDAEADADLVGAADLDPDPDPAPDGAGCAAAADPGGAATEEGRLTSAAVIEPPSVDGVPPSERAEGTNTPSPGEETGAMPAGPEDAEPPATGAWEPAAATTVPACGTRCPFPAGNRDPVRARTPTTTAASSEAVTSTGVSDRGRPRRQPALPPASADGGSALPPAGAGRWHRAALRPDGGEHRRAGRSR